MLNMSIMVKQAKCPNCGGPLAGLQASVIVCSFCQAEFEKAVKLPYKIPTPLPVNEPATLGTITVANQAYKIHGRIAQGAFSDVFLGRKDAALTEMVLIKVARDNPAHLLQEWQLLTTLKSRGTLLPTPLKQGLAQCAGRPDKVGAVYRWRTGFAYTLKDIKAQFPKGLETEKAIWIWNRLLEQIGTLHNSGYSHNAIAPEHMLIHPRDHGLLLCGWSKTAYGKGADDIKAAHVAIATILHNPPKLIQSILAKPAMDAFQVKEELKQVSQTLFGPSRFHPLVLA